MSKLLRDFYSGDTVSIAQALPGRYLVRMWDGQPLVARITETEAYVALSTRLPTPTVTIKRPGTPPCSDLRDTPISTSSTECTAA